MTDTNHVAGSKSRLRYKTIRHVEIPDNERENLSFLMVSAYQALKEASAGTGINGRRLRALLAERGTDREAWGELNLPQFALIKKHAPAIQAIFRVQDQLIEGYQKLVSRVIRQVSHFVVMNVEDATQEANIALLDSIFGYDGSQSFLPFAAGNIRRRLLRVSNDLQGVARLGRKASAVRRVVLRIHHQTRQPYGEILNDLSVPEQTREAVLSSLKRVVRPSRTDPDDVMARVPSEVPDPAELVAEEEERNYNVALVTVALENVDLSDYERKLIDLGLEGDLGWQTRLAQERGVTRSAVSAAYQKALGKLRAYIEDLVPVGV